MSAFLATMFAAALVLGGLARPLQADKRLQAGRTLVVSPQGPYTTIQAALEAAQAGDLIDVHPGVYSGALEVQKSVKLQGVGWPVIDGGGTGTVVTLAAPDITFQGFEVRASGIEPDRDHAGVTLTAPGITVQGNRLVDVLFGIFVAQADEAIVRGNDITSKVEYESGRKGDAIRVWYSQGVTVEDNHAHDARDVVMWYSKNLLVGGNTIERGRYGIHLMYCDGAVVERNRLRDNYVGIYAMYSNNIHLRENDIRGHHGTSGYAIGLKDADNVDVSGNVLVDNHAGAYLDGAPYTPQGYTRFQENIFAYNDIGVILLPAVNHAEFEKNVFWENAEQMSVAGGGQGENLWLANYWSDYAGFDANGDGMGDTPYQSERLFENLTDREPLLRALIYSPAAQAVEFAAAAFPIVRPQPKLTDTAPTIEPLAIPEFAARLNTNRLGMLISALAITGIGLAIAWIAFGGRQRRGMAGGASAQG